MSASILVARVTKELEEFIGRVWNSDGQCTCSCCNRGVAIGLRSDLTL